MFLVVLHGKTRNTARPVLSSGNADSQEDETEASRRKDLEEDLDIDVLTPDESYPTKQIPYIPIPSSQSIIKIEGTEENEEERAVRLIKRAKEWVGRQGDDDTWSGFFLSLDLTEKLEEDDSN